MMYGDSQMMRMRIPANSLIRNTREVMSRTFVPMVVFNRDKTKTSLVKAKKNLERMGV